MIDICHSRYVEPTATEHSLSVLTLRRGATRVVAIVGKGSTRSNSGNSSNGNDGSSSLLEILLVPVGFRNGKANATCSKGLSNTSSNSANNRAGNTRSDTSSNDVMEGLVKS